MKIKTKTKEIADKVKQLLTSWQGWLAFIIANVIWSTPWLIQFLLGFLFNDPRYYASAIATASFMALPFPIPMWLITPLTAFAIYKLIKGKPTGER